MFWNCSFQQQLCYQAQLDFFVLMVWLLLKFSPRNTLREDCIYNFCKLPGQMLQHVNMLWLYSISNFLWVATVKFYICNSICHAMKVLLLKRKLRKCLHYCKCNLFFFFFFLVFQIVLLNLIIFYPGPLVMGVFFPIYVGHITTASFL